MKIKKHVLITAGPTWVHLDKVRVISNIASGETGILLADKFKKYGWSVTLILGPCGQCRIPEGIKTIRFNYFDELKKAVLEEVKKNKYDICIHSAAVSDYRPLVCSKKKIASGKKAWNITLVPNVKIIDLLRKIDAGIILVGFKYEPDLAVPLLIREARALLNKAGLNFVVANKSDQQGYKAFCIDDSKIIFASKNKRQLADRLLKVLIKQKVK